VQIVDFILRSKTNRPIRRFGVHTKLQHVLHRNSFFCVVLHSLSKDRRDQQRFNGDEDRHDRAQQIPVRVTDRREIRKKRQHYN